MGLPPRLAAVELEEEATTDAVADELLAEEALAEEALEAALAVDALVVAAVEPLALETAELVAVSCSNSLALTLFILFIELLMDSKVSQSP